MKNTLLSTGLAIGLLASVNAHAMPMNLNIAGFELLETNQGNAQFSNVAGTQLNVFWLDVPAAVTIGNDDAPVEVSEDYDGLELNLVLNSIAPPGVSAIEVTAQLFATWLSEGTEQSVEGDLVVLSEAVETLSLSFDSLANRTLTEYGVILTALPTMTAAVSEPSTLAVMGAGMLALTLVARRKAVI